MTTQLEVLKGIAIPEIDRAPKKPRSKYPLATMVVGDAIFSPGRDTRSLSAYISRISKKLPGKFITRHCWMRAPSATEQRRASWVECSRDHPDAVEGSGVWRVE